MPKVSEAAQETQRTRPPRVAAPAVSFCNKNEEEEEILGVVLDEIRVQEEDEDDFAGIGRLLKDLYKRQAKKTTLANAAYENQKKAIYTAGRHLAQEIVRDAVRQLDNVEESLLEMKKREWSYERYVADIIPLWNEQDALINQLLDTYDHPLDDVFPNRAETIASAEQTRLSCLV
ncbi:hypothetical protein E1B28_009115 [Marasmius oreades]|uniref:Uncharacterized protein n=1 Tax=Marasmius oreades TaxID=181124 RepID=A0A9P7S0E2_9AGAR|nr:uncharacterized protein E1B28_009115 [Marasmius oreades]KAG7092797.1 hypothetical protein E1B28_009115 [Marasmius oreades]